MAKVKIKQWVGVSNDSSKAKVLEFNSKKDANEYIKTEKRIYKNPHMFFDFIEYKKPKNRFLVFKKGKVFEVNDDKEKRKIVVFSKKIWADATAKHLNFIKDKNFREEIIEHLKTKEGNMHFVRMERLVKDKNKV